MTFKKLFSAAALAAVVFSASRLAMAANQTCNLTQDNLDALKAIENDNSIDYAARIKSALDKRKEILSEVVRCAINEAANLKSDLDRLNADDADTQKLQSQFSNQLQNAVNYYQAQISKIGDLGLQGSRIFAKDLSSWRAGNYNDTAKRISNFIIWNQNQPFIKTAKGRVYMLGQTIGLLSIVGNDKIQFLWKDAMNKFNDATSLNDQAKTSLLAFGPPDESLDAIQLSLEKLAETYKGLFDTISAINAALSK